MSKNYIRVIGFALLLMVAMMACQKMLPGAPAKDQLLDGPVEGLTTDQHLQFLRGDVAFNDEVFVAETGLGPLFVATSCGSCHAGDGKGHPFTTLTRFGQPDTSGNRYLQQGGPQLQHRALPGFLPEQLPAGATFSRFMPPANTGLGFLDAVPDAELLKYADPDDADGDGISGRPNWITLPGYCSLRTGAVQQNGKYIGRFGKKAAVYDLLQQTATAYNQDMGITSAYEPHDTYNGHAIDPEISIAKVLDVVFYLKTLKVPFQRKPENAVVKAGRQHFLALRCSSCHVPELKTGYSSIAALSYKVFYPYTDLLLHDMGPGLNDGYTEGTALPEEWRTPPLWGLGLSMNAQGGSYFLMHDGRAGSIREAILMHGGEAQQSRDRFQQLTEPEQQELIKFLESL
ncbi:thiol oxidoreductase [Niabella sp. CC-SYL272]|uniref:di-heme oxidoredictase family protein n=1 Tax=Niabella agricola TaxID=2891571 RepID=UPI001F2DF36F|nr:di-heme oxidoredictase family protein [Niabella agricola]MCF3107591.1 thiol oxidoreductase [Niabella agricola]